MPTANRSSSGPRRPETEAQENGGRASFAEEFTNLLSKPFDLLLLTTDWIQNTFDEAVELGRMTRADANELMSELVRRGRQQTEVMLGDLTDRARRTISTPSIPIPDYSELTVAQVTRQLPDLTQAQLRALRDFERRHANRKSVLAAIDKALA